MAAKFKSAFSARTRKPFSCTGASMTKQSFQKECDINTLLARYQKTGLLTHVAAYQGDYSDLSDVPDYHTAMNAILNAQFAFDTLPSSIRKHFNNDPAQFLDFVSDPDNADEMQEMGLIPAAPIQEPVPQAPEPEPTP